MADLKLTVDTSDLTKAVRTTDQTRQALRFLGQQFARSNDQSAYLRAVNQVVKAQRMLGVESRMSRSEIMQLGAQYRQQTLFADELSRAQLQMAQATQQATNSVRRLNTVAGAMRQGMSRSSVAIQQTGYQVGDFLVQVQSGTNAFVAFGQQATQMAGLLTLSMNPAMVALGAALSILIPLSTAAAAMFVRSRNAGQEAADAFEEVANALRAMNSATEAATSPMSDLAERFGENTEQARQFLSVLRAVEQIRFQGAFSEAAQALRDAFDFGDFGAESLAALQDAGRAQETLLQSLLQRQRNLLQEGNNQAALALETQINELRSQYERAFGAMARDVESLASRLGITNEQANEFATILARIQEAQTFEQRGEAALALADYIRQNVEITENLSEAEQDAVENAVQLALQFLEASENAGRIPEALAGASPIVRVLVEELGKTREEAERAASALEALMDFNSGNVVAQINAITNALRIGTAQAIALAQAMPGYTSGGVSGPDGAVAQTQALTGQGLNFRAIIPEGAGTSGGRSGGGGGGGGGFVSGVPAIRELQAAIEAAADEARRFEQEISLLDSAIENGVINQQQYNELVAAAESAYGRAQQGAYDYEAALESLDNTFASSLEDTFMSIIDGSKSAGEAFRDMARQMIAEAMRMLVIRPLIQSLFGRFAGGGPFAAIGGALGGKFESGGNMRPGVPYLVGERGPELVIPGRSATVTNANLTERTMSGGQAVNVYQTINVSTGVQQTVRNEIKQLMPQIAESAKSAVVDAKRRGGSYGRAFS